MFKNTGCPYDEREAHTKTSVPGLISIMRIADPIAIGPSIHIKGEVRGNEDLIVHGRIEGTIDLGEGSLRVTRQGCIEGDVIAGVITIEGRAKGNLRASERLIVRRTGQVRGTVTAPRVGLDFGCKFSGSIDSEIKGKVDDRRTSAGGQRNVVDFDAARWGTRGKTGRRKEVHKDNRR